MIEFVIMLGILAAFAALIYVFTGLNSPSASPGSGTPSDTTKDQAA